VLSLIDSYLKEVKKFINQNNELFKLDNASNNYFDIPVNDDVKDYFKINNERLRNLKIKLFHFREKNEVDTFTLKELNKKLYFKISDIIFYADKFFDKNEDEFTIQPELLDELNDYENKQDHLPDNIDGMEEEFKSHYRYLKKNLSNLGRVNDWQERIEKMNNLATKLHWKYMPIYEEYMLENRGIIPEENIEEYYDHYHSLEDLYREIVGEGLDWKSTEGDCNIDKELTFEVFTTRWGHEDRYRMKRTIYGWYVKHISINGYSQKNGIGALFSNFRQDGVFYPEDGVKHALETLWNDADNSEMSADELQKRLQEIAYWVSEVEKATKSTQPSWVNYY
jgi:hypothetical protein